ncbi:MAG TPA: hypothetical protein VJN64_10350 [Terriglobales bacterium]|nr:hypothetical protein [Terriglobales bacterium]
MIPQKVEAKTQQMPELEESPGSPSSPQSQELKESQELEGSPGLLAQKRQGAGDRLRQR